MNKFNRESTRFEKNKRKWPSICKEIGDYFRNSTFLNCIEYDKSRYLKIDRQNFEEYQNKNKLKLKLKLKYKNVISDHKPIYRLNMMCWNTLHHFSYNGSNDYIVDNNHMMTEKKRYEIIANQITYEIENPKTGLLCLAFQEFEFSIYTNVVQYIMNSKLKYSSRFVPRRISYDNHGLYIESYGNAIFVKNNEKSMSMSTYAYPISKSKSCKYENHYKYVIHEVNDISYCSLHLPKCCSNTKDKWLEYTIADIKHILSHICEYGYILGDFNMKRKYLEQFLKRFPKFDFDIGETTENSIDFIIKVTRLKSI